MKTVDLSDAVESLAEYATGASTEPVLVTRRGKPLAAVISMKGVDRETLALSMNPKFMSIIEEARASRTRGTIPAEEMRKRLGIAKPISRHRKK